MLCALIGILSGLVVFAYIFVWQKPKSETRLRYGHYETVPASLDGWVIKLIVFSALASLFWFIFWPAVIAVKLAKVIKAFLDDRQSV